MIISFVGFKQIGKTTAAKYMEETYGFRRINMKDALVAEVRANFPDLLELMADGLTVDDLFIQKPPLMRALLQNYGTEVRRKDDEKYWTQQWRAEATEQGGHIVVDDVRFHNEAEAVRGINGVIVRLTRPDVETGGSHSSEVEQLEIKEDYAIECEKGDFEKLYKELDVIMAMHGQAKV